MGLWLEEQRHGNAVVVTQSGVYYEGIFRDNKMSVSLLIMFPILISRFMIYICCPHQCGSGIYFSFFKSPHSHQLMKVKRKKIAMCST